VSWPCAPQRPRSRSRCWNTTAAFPWCRLAPPRFGVNVACRVLRSWEPVFVPSSFASCRDSRTRCQPGQAHPGADPRCGLHRDTARVVATRAEPRAARRAWAPRCAARGCWDSLPPSGRPEPTQTPFPGSTSPSPPGASPARARATRLKSRAAAGVSLVTG
jgi:hypothetical protein